MGPPKSSRKGKKAWRKNIDVSEVEERREEATYQERRGPAVDTLDDSQLFFVDKDADRHAASAGGQRKPRQRIRGGPQPLLRSQIILQQAHKAKPVMQYKPPRKINDASNKEEAVKRKAKFSAIPGEDLDLWGSADLAGPSTSAPGRRQPKPVNKVRAVEVDMAGCSYNPEPEAHQDALGVLVATEMRKVLKRELAPISAPKLVMAQPEDELEALQVDAEPDDEDDNEILLEDEEDEDGAMQGRKPAVKKLTKDRNREKRRTVQEKELEEKQKLKRQRRDLEQLSQIQVEIEEEIGQQELRNQRRKVVHEEKAATLPPRLGKQKFEPASVQVATTDELSGSLRCVRAFPMIALDRFKSLQHRGLIEPRRPVHARLGRRVSYEKGARTEKALAGQAEIDEIRKQRKEAARAAKK